MIGYALSLILSPRSMLFQAPPCHDRFDQILVDLSLSGYGFPMPSVGIDVMA
jgi:hypothetical protein